MLELLADPGGRPDHCGPSAGSVRLFLDRLEEYDREMDERVARYDYS
ncbi:hypothetical protein [Streptomyces buecherae]